MPNRSKQAKRKQRVNWIQRDKEIAGERNKTLLEQRSGMNKPVRTTVSRIGRSIGKLSLLEQHLDKLPICQGILNINMETEEQHQIRKIDWASKKIKQQGKRPVNWRILRVAGIRVLKTKKVEQYLRDIIGGENHNHHDPAA
jgi:hypothetical protein